MDRYKLRQRQSDEILIEEKKVKSYGNNYLAFKVKNRLSFSLLVKLVVCFFVFAALVLGILVLCGI